MAYVPTATNPYIDHSSVIFDFKSVPFTSPSFLSGTDAKRLTFVNTLLAPWLFTRYLCCRTDELDANLRRTGDETSLKLLIMFEIRTMQKNAATVNPYRIQIGILNEISQKVTLLSTFNDEGVFTERERGVHNIHYAYKHSISIPNIRAFGSVIRLLKLSHCTVNPESDRMTGHLLNRIHALLIKHSEDALVAKLTIDSQRFLENLRMYTA